MEGTAADVTDRRKPTTPAVLIHLRSDPVQLTEAYRDEHRVLRGSIALLDVFERNNIHPEELPISDVFLMDGECDHTIGTVFRQVNVGHLGKVARAEYDDRLRLLGAVPGGRHGAPRRGRVA